jgi:hypothetical protein
MATSHRERISRVGKKAYSTLSAGFNGSSRPDSVARWVRVWAVALGVAAVSGLGGMALTWAILPQQFTYTASVQFKIQPLVIPGVSDDQQPDAAKDRLAQEDLIKSEQVLKAACAQPGILQLSLLASQADPMGWLQNNLGVMSSADKGVMEARISGGDDDETVKLLDAIKDAYLTAATKTDRHAVGQIRREWEREYRGIVAAVDAKMDELHRAMMAEMVTSGDVVELGETERVSWAVTMSGNQERTRNFQGLLGYLDRANKTLQAAIDGSVQYTARGGVKETPKSPKWMQLMREQAAQGVAPPPSTPPEQIYSMIHEVEVEKADVEEELRVAQEEVDEAGRTLESLVADSPELQKQKKELDSLKAQMYTAEEPLLALRSLMAGPSRITLLAEPTAVQSAVGNRNTWTAFYRGLIASLVGFATVFMVDGLLRKYAAV